MDVLMIEIEPETYIYGDMGQMLFHQIMSDNLLDSCKYFIINIIGDLKLSTQAKPTAVDIIKSYGFNIEDYKRKPCKHIISHASYNYEKRAITDLWYFNSNELTH